MTASVDMPLERSKFLGIIPLELALNVSASPEIGTPVQEGFVRQPRKVRIPDRFMHAKKKALYPSLNHFGLSVSISTVLGDN
jgi:hypothetical protein